MPLRFLTFLLAFGAAAALAQPLPDATTLAKQAAARFPQPVRAGDLVGRQVLEPLESQPVLGRVRSVVQRQDGVAVVIEYNVALRLFTRPIAVPVTAVALIGDAVSMVGYTPAQLDQLPSFDGTGATTLPPYTVLKLGLTGPSH